MNRHVELKLTGDGSHTLFVPELNENYHSYHGAYAESLHVFIKMGLLPMMAHEPIQVFEVGFGTGLNAILSYAFAKDHQHPVYYTRIEKYTLSEEVIAQLNYKDHWKNTEVDTAFKQMHQSVWNTELEINNYFRFLKIAGDVITT